MNNKKYQGGLVQAILLLIIALVVASFFGFGPQTVWEEYLAPIFGWLWKLIVAIVDFSVEMLRAAWGAAKGLVGIVDGIE